MSLAKPRPLTEQERTQMRAWLENWRRVGPLLEQERWDRVAALTDDAAWEEAQGILRAWESHMPGDAGEGLLLQQLVFSKWAKWFGK